MLWLLSSFLYWFASPQGANYLRACFSFATALGMDGRIVTVAMGLLSLWLVFH